MAKQAKRVEVPQGYAVKVTAELPESWDFVKFPVLEGTVQAVQSVKITDKDGVRHTRVAHVANARGIFGLWESATLLPLFDALKDGMDIFVRFEGLGEAKPGRSAAKLFTAAIRS